MFFNESIVAQGVTEAVDAEDIDGDGDVDLGLIGNGSINTQTGEATCSRTLRTMVLGNFTIGKWLNDNYSSFTSFWQSIKIIDFNQDGVEDVLKF